MRRPLSRSACLLIVCVLVLALSVPALGAAPVAAGTTAAGLSDTDCAAAMAGGQLGWPLLPDALAAPGSCSSSPPTVLLPEQHLARNNAAGTIRLGRSTVARAAALQSSSKQAVTSTY